MLDYRYLAGMDGMYNNMLAPTAANQIGSVNPAIYATGMTNPGARKCAHPRHLPDIAQASAQSGFIPAAPGTVAPYNPASGQSGFVDQIQQDAYGRFTTAPDYLFRFNEGQRMLDSSAAARGMLMSGNQLRALTELGQNLASQEYGNYMNRLYGVAGLAPSGGQALAAQGGAQGFNQMFNAAGSLGTNLGNIAGPTPMHRRASGALR